MKSNQTPQKSSIRRSKENPSKSKIIAKSLSSALSAASEDDPIDSQLQSAISDGDPRGSIPDEISNPSLLDSSEQIDLWDFASEVEIGHGTRVLSEASRISGRSNGFRTKNVEVDVAVDLLLRACDQVVKSADVDRRSKKIVEDLIRSVIDPLDLSTEERDGFYALLREKVYVGLVFLFACVVSVSFVVIRDIGTGMEFPDTLRPTGRSGCVFYLISLHVRLVENT